jgi:release factor glutamine methyltransferase
MTCEATGTTKPTDERVRSALQRATQRLHPISDTPRLDAELLMAHALEIERETLLMQHLDCSVPEHFAPLLCRRLANEPVAYIIGWREFWTIRLNVRPGVLIPRADSEALIEAAIGHFTGRAPQRILDLGTGPGTLLLAALSHWPEATGLGIERSETALGQAQQNAVALGLSGRAEFRSGNWGKGVNQQFDLILCNPPYIESKAALAPQVLDYEPHEALFAGPDGLEDYRRLARQFANLLLPNACVALEIGAGQADAVSALMARQGFSVATYMDLGGHVRCLLLTAG